MALTSKSILQRYGKERRFDESDNSLLSRLLTVRFNDANLTKIGDLSELTNLVKLYVRNNHLNNISTAPQLTYLYVINNKLTELASITKLTKLEKLYAGGNNIQVLNISNNGVDNLDFIENL